MGKSEGPKEYRFQLIVREESVFLEADNGFRYEYPRDFQGCKEIIRFLVGSKRQKTTHTLDGLGRNH